MGACQARRRPARERRCSPTVIINLRPGHLREPGQPRPCRLPFYAPVLSTAENGAHRSPGALTMVCILAAPGYLLCPPPHGGSPSLESARPAQQIRDCGRENAHARGRVHNLTRALGHFRSRPCACTPILQEWPGGCNRRRSALELPSSLKDFKVLMLSSVEQLSLSYGLLRGGKSVLFYFKKFM